MKRFAMALGGLIGVLLVVVLVRTGSLEETPPAGTAPLVVTVDADAALQRFAEALRFETISHGPDSGVSRDDAAFSAFRDFLVDRYPRVHAGLELELVAEHTLLYTWAGSDPALAPLVMMGHYDVVPVDPTALGRWIHPPFEGVIEDGYLWGRGAIDNKINVIAQLEAVEALLAQAFSPTRTILLSYGHDEELGGDEGATAVVALLKQRGVRPAFVLDEGGGVMTGEVIPGLDADVAAIGIAEKGYVNVELIVEAAGGHSSAPPKQTAIGILASAIHALERNPMPSHFEDGIMRQTLVALAPRMDFGPRAVMRNLWLSGPVVQRVMLSTPALAPGLRTTTAATIFQGGVKANALPTRARAIVNFRIFPGDSVTDVMEHVRRVIDDDRIVVSAPSGREPSSVTSVETSAWATLSDTIRQVYPEVALAPFLIPGGTDARYFREICDNVFGFVPMRNQIEEMKRAHGNDERIRVDSFTEAIDFYARLMMTSEGWD